MNFAFFKPWIKKKYIRCPSNFERAADIFESKISVWDITLFKVSFCPRKASAVTILIPRGFPLKTPSICGPRETLCFGFLTRASLRKLRLKGKWPGSRNDQTRKWWSHMKYCFIEKSCLLMLVTLIPLVTFCRCRELRTNTLSKFK